MMVMKNIGLYVTLTVILLLITVISEILTMTILAIESQFIDDRSMIIKKTIVVSVTLSMILN